MSNNENTLGKDHWLVKGNIGVTLKDKTRNIHNSDNRQK